MADKAIVVGAGVMGSWCAWKLLKAGFQVHLYEQQTPGHTSSSSGGESRLIRGIYGGDEIYQQWVIDSLPEWQILAEQSEKPIYESCGTLWLFGENYRYADESFSFLQSKDWPIEKWEVVKAMKRFPQFNFEDIQHIYFEPESGYLWAREGVRSLVEQFRDHGGHLHQSGVKLNGDQLFDANQNSIEGDVIIFAIGPWLPVLFPELKDKLWITRQEVYYFLSEMSKPKFTSQKMPAWIDLSDLHYYGVPITRDRSFKIADDTREQELDISNAQRIPTESKIQSALSYIQHRFPDFKQPQFIEGRVCQYTNTPDGHLILDRHPEKPHWFIAGGGCGHSYKLGPAIGSYMVDLVHNAKSLEKFSVARLATDANFQSPFKRNSTFD